jgi:hypothetical protein
MTKQEIRNLISEDRLDEAINILLKVTEQDDHLYRQVGTMSANYSNYKKRTTTGQLSYQEQNQGTATIANGLLNVIDEIWKDGDIRVPPTTKQPHKQPYLWYVLVGITTLLIALGLWYYAPTPAVLEPHTTTQPVVFKLHNKNGESAGIPKITGKIILEIPTISYKDTAYINEESTAIFDKVPIRTLRMGAIATLISNDYIAAIDGKSFRIERFIDYPVIRKNIPIASNPPSNPPPSPPKPKTIALSNDFIGTWKNRNTKSNGFQKLIITQSNDKAKVQLIGYGDADVGNLNTVIKSPTHLHIGQFTYLTTNKYSDVDFQLQESGILKMTYKATLTNGSVYDMIEEFSHK